MDEGTNEPAKIGHSGHVVVDLSNGVIALGDRHCANVHNAAHISCDTAVICARRLLPATW